jgi:hypothetical protein
VTLVSYRRDALGGFWIVAASGLDVALKLAAEGSKVSCVKKVAGRDLASGRGVGGVNALFAADECKSA